MRRRQRRVPVWAERLPTETFNSANYWVDVVFDTSVGPIPRRPTVTASTPANGATGVVHTAVTATFSEELNAATVTTATWNFATRSTPWCRHAHLRGQDPDGDAAADRRARRVPTYTARVRGGSTGIKDLAGNALASDSTWTFTTSCAGRHDATAPWSARHPEGGLPEPLDSRSTATFSEPNAADTVSNATFECGMPANALVPAHSHLRQPGTAGDAATDRDPRGLLRPYTATLPRAVRTLNVLSGNALSADDAGRSRPWFQELVSPRAQSD